MKIVFLSMKKFKNIIKKHHTVFNSSLRCPIAYIDLQTQHVVTSKWLICHDPIWKALL